MSTARNLALEALRQLDRSLEFADWENGDGEEIGAQLREAVAALLAETGEPVAWRIWSPDGANVYQYTEDGDGEPLYTAPPPAVPQSDNEEFRDVWQSVMALRGLMNSGHIKPDQDQRDKLVLAAEIDRYVQQLQERDSCE